jgi:hypothetical protein
MPEIKDHWNKAENLTLDIQKLKKQVQALHEMAKRCSEDGYEPKVQVKFRGENCQSKRDANEKASRGIDISDLIPTLMGLSCDCLHADVPNGKPVIRIIEFLIKEDEAKIKLLKRSLRKCLNTLTVDEDE